MTRAFHDNDQIYNIIQNDDANNVDHFDVATFHNTSSNLKKEFYDRNNMDYNYINDVSDGFIQKEMVNTGLYMKQSLMDMDEKPTSSDINENDVKYNAIQNDGVLREYFLNKVSVPSNLSTTNFETSNLFLIDAMRKYNAMAIVTNSSSVAGSTFMENFVQFYRQNRTVQLPSFAIDPDDGTIYVMKVSPSH